MSANPFISRRAVLGGLLLLGSGDRRSRAQGFAGLGRDVAGFSAVGRGGVGQAGVEATPFRAWIDSWQMRGLEGMSADTVAPLELTASGADFSYALRLETERPLVLEGNAGYSKKSERGQASYYYSQ